MGETPLDPDYDEVEIEELVNIDVEPQNQGTEGLNE